MPTRSATRVPATARQAQRTRRGGGADAYIAPVEGVVRGFGGGGRSHSVLFRSRSTLEANRVVSSRRLIDALGNRSRRRRGATAQLRLLARSVCRRGRLTTLSRYGAIIVFPRRPVAPSATRRASRRRRSRARIDISDHHRPCAHLEGRSHRRSKSPVQDERQMAGASYALILNVLSAGVASVFPARSRALT